MVQTYQKINQRIGQTINLEGLNGTQIAYVRRLIESLKRPKEMLKRQAKDKIIELKSWDLGIKGKLTREEIYD